MRKFLVAAGLAGALVALPVGSAVGAAPGHAFKGKGTGTLTRTGSSFAIDGTITIVSVGKAAFHAEGTSAGSTVAYTTTFTAGNGDTLTTSSTGAARAHEARPGVHHLGHHHWRHRSLRHRERQRQDRGKGEVRHRGRSDRDCEVRRRRQDPLLVGDQSAGRITSRRNSSSSAIGSSPEKNRS